MTPAHHRFRVDGVTVGGLANDASTAVWSAASLVGYWWESCCRDVATVRVPAPSVPVQAMMSCCWGGTLLCGSCRIRREAMDGPVEAESS